MSTMENFIKPSRGNCSSELKMHIWNSSKIWGHRAPRGEIPKQYK